MSVPGKVFLVGAGPGDPGLITARGQKCLAEADLILYDGLVNPLLLLLTSAEATRTCRTSTPAGLVLDQDDINRRLIEAARAGKTVVRLKGGDPFIFGRGGEEAFALREAGIEFEVVPGVTAATAASAYAGISLTHRSFASAVAFVTGHEDPHKPGNALDYEALAKFPGTLVFYMGLHRLAEIAETLIAAGKPAETPAAVVCSGSTPQQRTVSAPLGGLAAEVDSAGLHAPSLIFIGESVRQRETIQWFERRPLFGMRIGIARPIGQAISLVDRVIELGAEPVLLPTIAIHPPDDWEPVDASLARLSDFDWIVFTSVNGVRFFLGRLWEIGGDLRWLGGVKLAAIGSGTAEALRDFQLRPEVVPAAYRAEALAEALQPHVDGKHVLWPRASRGRDVLPTELRAAGAAVNECVVYRNIDVDSLPDDQLKDIEQGRIDWIGLSSPSIARSLRRLLSRAALEQLGKGVQLASISPVTTAAAREAGLPVSAEAATYTWEGILQAIVAAVADGGGAASKFD